MILLYIKIPQLRQPNNKTTLLLRTPSSSPKLGFPYILISIIKTTPLIRPLLDSPKGGLYIGVLLYLFWVLWTLKIILLVSSQDNLVGRQTRAAGANYLAILKAENLYLPLL